MYNIKIYSTSMYSIQYVQYYTSTTVLVQYWYCKLYGTSYPTPHLVNYWSFYALVLVLKNYVLVLVCNLYTVCTVQINSAPYTYKYNSCRNRI